MLSSLPDELILMICDYLNTNEVITLGQVNRRLYSVLNDPWLWFQVCKNRYDCKTEPISNHPRLHYISVHNAAVHFLEIHKMESLTSSNEAKRIFWECNYGLEYYLERLEFKNASCLLEHGFSLSKMDDEGNTLLHRFVEKGEDYIDTIIWLLENGANVNAEDFVCWTPLHHAAFHKYYEITQVLIKFNADVTKKDYQDKTPYDIAVNENADDSYLLLFEQQSSSLCYTM